MIAHSGFTRSHLPGSFSEWTKENGQKHLSDFHSPPNFPHHSAPAPAAPAKLYAAGSKIVILDDPAVDHSVPMAMHLDHLKITAKAERSFGFRLGFLAGVTLMGIARLLDHLYG